jgi:hypothetical protein
MTMTTRGWGRWACVAIVCAAVAGLASSCGSGSANSQFVAKGGDDATVGNDTGSSTSPDAGMGQPESGGTLGSPEGGFQDGGGCMSSTCSQLDANCGPVTDPKCGGVIQCGSCPTGQSCGNAGPNQCGTTTPDACTPMTCAQQNANCGMIGDGCGNMLSCGSCTSPTTCGGAKANQCGCTGVCAQIPTCDAGATTTLTGTVLDPAGIHPLYDALVYIPNNPMDPGLQPFPPGITCDVCGTTAAGDPLVTAFTAPDGTFTLSGVPVGTSITLVIQLGKWRRIFQVNIPNACAANSIAAGTLTMPKNHTEGDIPRISILTGGYDPIECVLRKMGVQDSEFTDPGGAGHIQFYLAADPNAGSDGICPQAGGGSGASIDSATPQQSALFGTTSGQPTINQYDVVLLACEGYEEDNTADWPNLAAYTSAGGRAFMTDFAYNWMASSCGQYVQCSGDVEQNPAYTNVATWDTGQMASGAAETGKIDLVSNPKGMAFEQWLQDVGASASGSGTVSLNPVFHNSNGITAPTEQWLYWASSTPIHFTFNTPVGATPANQCGLVAFSDWHADQLGASGAGCAFEGLSSTPPYLSHGLTFPNECDSNPMTPQEAVLEFMLFDLTACVQPYKPLCTPTTCAAQNIQCGPAGDGCGNLLQCGPCPTGQFCGGGGPGKCGMANTCTPETCASQNIQCGQAGDGCGNVLNCGNCPTGEVCGLNSPGQCGSLQ